MDASSKALVQHKQDLISALKRTQYTAAASILQLALAVSPDDTLLTELAAVVQAKVQQDESEDNSSEEASEGESSADETASEPGDEQQESSNDDSGSASGSKCRGAEEAEVASSSSNGSLQQHVQHGGTAEAGAAIQAHQPVTFSGKATAVCYEEAQAAQHDSGRMALAQSGNVQHHKHHVSSIQLAAGCCTLTPQRRAELRQQLAAAIEEQKMALVQEHLVANDPLLSAI